MIVEPGPESEPNTSDVRRPCRVVVETFEETSGTGVEIERVYPWSFLTRPAIRWTLTIRTCRRSLSLDPPTGWVSPKLRVKKGRSSAAIPSIAGIAACLKCYTCSQEFA